MLVQHAPWWGWVPAVTNGNTNGKSNGYTNSQTGHIMANKPSYRLATVPTVATVDTTSSGSTDSPFNDCELVWSPGCDTALSGPETDSDCDQLMRINSSSSSSDIAAIVQRIAQFAASNSSAEQQSAARTSSAKQVQPLALAVLKLYSKADTVQDTAQQHYAAKAIALTSASEITTALHDLVAGLYGQQACLQACVHESGDSSNSSNISDHNQQHSQQQQSQQQQQQQQQQHTAFYRVLWRRGKRAIVAHVQCKYPAVLNVGSHLCAVTGDSTAFTLTEVQDSELEKLAIYKTDQLVKTLHRSFSGKAKRDSYSSGGYNYSGNSSERPSTAYSNRTDEPRSNSNSIQQLYCDWCFVGSSTTTATTSTNGDNTVTAATTITTVGTSSSSSSNDTLLLWEVHGLQTAEQYKLDCASRKLNYETKLNLNLKLANRPHLSETNTATAVVNSALTLAHPSVTEQAVQELKQQQHCRPTAQQQHQHGTASTKQAVAWQCGGGLCEPSFNELNFLNSNYLNMQTEEPRIVQYSLVAKGRAVLFGEHAAPTTVSRSNKTAQLCRACYTTYTDIEAARLERVAEEQQRFAAAEAEAIASKRCARGPDWKSRPQLQLELALQQDKLQLNQMHCFHANSVVSDDSNNAQQS
eukprot:18130-Heterococcus_DN1.PRE.1